jgi:hypothetical protein
MPIATRSTGETKDVDADPDRHHPSQAGHDAPGVPALTPKRARLPGRLEPSSDSALTQPPHSVRGDDGRGMIVRAAVALSYGRGGDAGADAAEGAAGGPAGEPGNPTLLIDCTMPSLRQAHSNFREQYALPLSVCMITPRASPPRVVSSHGSYASLRAVPGRPLGDPCASVVASVRWCTTGWMWNGRGVP